MSNSQNRGSASSRKVFSFPRIVAAVILVVVIFWFWWPGQKEPLKVIPLDQAMKGQKHGAGGDSDLGPRRRAVGGRGSQAGLAQKPDGKGGAGDDSNLGPERRGVGGRGSQAGSAQGPDGKGGPIRGAKARKAERARRLAAGEQDSIDSDLGPRGTAVGGGSSKAGSEPGPDGKGGPIRGAKARKAERARRLAAGEEDLMTEEELNTSYGFTQPVPNDLNPQTQSVAEALRTMKNPERLSVLHLPEPFNLASYQADPQKYLNTIEPGRVFQPAQPGENVSRIRTVESQHFVVEQGSAVTLRIRAVPGAPVTFTSFDLGEFENRLTSITVAADEEGIAETKFFGTSGTINNVNILAASPITAGQVKFIVNVRLPK